MRKVIHPVNFFQHLIEFCSNIMHHIKSWSFGVLLEIFSYIKRTYCVSQASFGSIDASPPPWKEKKDRFLEKAKIYYSFKKRRCWHKMPQGLLVHKFFWEKSSTKFLMVLYIFFPQILLNSYIMCLKEWLFIRIMVVYWKIVDTVVATSVLTRPIFHTKCHISQG